MAISPHLAQSRPVFQNRRGQRARGFCYEFLQHSILFVRRPRRALRFLRQLAGVSLDEEFEEMLPSHRLGVFEELGASFKTTRLYG